MKINKFLTVFAFIIVFTSNVMAEQMCDGQFPNGQRPVLVNKNLMRSTKELCFNGFTLLHSGVVRQSLYSSEHLTRERVEKAASLPRIDSFHVEQRLNPEERSELKDYAKSGYDRGHLSPNKDMSDTEMQSESFSLANMIMQNPNNNRNLHEGIEEVVRSMARQYNEVYVSTGPAWIGSPLKQVGNLIVATNVWKAVYIPSNGAAAAYWEKNANGMDYEIISMAELTKRIGVDVFPFLTAQKKNTTMQLPSPTPHKFR
jgi:endonuclease G